MKDVIQPAAPRRTRWKPRVGRSPYSHWLTDEGSLTQRLQASCARFSVENVRQRWGRPQSDEAMLLRLRRGECTWLREVTLCCAGRPVVFASSVLPRRSLRGAWRDLGRLGARPLGAALFADPRVCRTPLAYCRLRPRDALFRRAAAMLGTVPTALWARRSVFLLQRAPILVTEVFLPGVLEL